MLNTLYLLHYNNYYNRRAKKEETIEDYKALNTDEAPIILASFDNINFIPNDWVDTVQVLNWEGGDRERPDYLLVTEKWTEMEEDEEGFTETVEKEKLVSRWFIISMTRTTAGQTQLELHRDLIVDYYDDVMNTDCFVEKGNVQDIDDPAIYNDEDMSFSQIKVKETLLPDKTGTPWVVGYVPRTFMGKKDANGTITYEKDQQIGPLPLYIETSDVEELENGIENWQYNQYVDTWYGEYISQNYTIYTTCGPETINFKSRNLRGYLIYSYSTGQISATPLEDITGVSGDNTARDRFNCYVTMEADGTGFQYTKAASTWHKLTNAERQTCFSPPTATNASNINTSIGNLIRDKHNIIRGYNDGIGGRPSISNLKIPKITPGEYNELLSLKGKRLHDVKTGAYFEVQIEEQESDKYADIDVPYNEELWRLIRDGGVRGIYSSNSRRNFNIEGRSCVGLELFGIGSNQADRYMYLVFSATNDQSIRCSGYAKNIKVSLKQIPSGVMTTISRNRLHLQDSPYDMFCLPYSDDLLVKYGTSYDIPDTYITPKGDQMKGGTSKLSSLYMAQGLALALGQDDIYDIQLLPYCPIDSVKLLDDGKTLDITGCNRSIVYIAEYDGENYKPGRPVSVMLWANKSTFSPEIKFDPIPEDVDVLDKKINSQVEMYRLCSPNYSGVFEFNPQKNEGISKFNCWCTYKPYAPYIRIAPDFGGLYGADFKDSRGLVCGGDFSTAQITDAWADYQLQNKNYQQMFDRGITNMEINNAVQREKEQWQVAANTMQAYASGKQAGNRGIRGLLTGGASGRMQGMAQAGFSLAAGLRDIELNDKLRNEAIDYAKDMFGYQLDNIQALPQGLSRVTADNADNKYIPFLEKYNCDVIGQNYQRNALLNKLKYNGMTIMRIDRLFNYCRPWSYTDSMGDVHKQDEVYVKGRVIRLNDLNEDYHIGTAIAEEVMKGFFVDYSKEQEEVTE